ncbi:MAG: nucleotide exchange factor GrpE [Clostridiales bacterium]|jgi:molecular chaperone GrpE|nr:nucleotide exchange factor GrpE [Clostridiales bacterium]
MKKHKKNIFELNPDNIFDEITELQDEMFEGEYSKGNDAEEEPEIIDAPQPQSADAKYGEMLDKYQRCLAEFDNYRKRTDKEKAGRYDDGIRAACEKLLPIVDNFERALNACDDKENNFYKGIEMIARQFDNTLEELGVKAIATEPGVDFNAHHHYAVAHTEDENFGENVVAEVLQKGYVHKERVIRPAMVKVAN